MKFLRSLYIVPFLFLSLCLILMLTTRSVYSFDAESGNTFYYFGEDVMFAHSWYRYTGYGIYEPDVNEPSASAILAFVSLCVASITLIAAAIVAMVGKERSFMIFSGVLGLVSMALILVAAISIRFVPTDWSYFTKGVWSEKTEFHLAEGYSAVSIISFIAAPMCLPSAIACFVKEKQEEPAK